jgi:NodT family efflux transporter outer membrane factor (OMF) lipoprotein
LRIDLKQLACGIDKRFGIVDSVKTGGIIGLGLMVALLAGCVQVAPPGEDSLTVEVPGEWTAAQVASEWPSGWLEDFADPGLEALVEEAFRHNLSLQAAMARLEQAQALARIEGADRWPDVSLGGTARRQMSNSLDEPVFRSRSDRFGFDAVVNWELDLWGRVRAQAKAAVADAMAAEADYAAFRLSLASRVAQAWFTAIEERRQESLALETVTSFESNLETVEERFRRGLSPALDVRLTRANVASARATYAQQRRQADLAVRQLEVLIGRYPAGKLAPGEWLVELPGDVPAGLPADLLERRPDVRASAQRLVSADASLIESKRSLLPAIRLTGSYGRASSELENLLEDPFDVWSLVGNLTAPVFQGGRLRANVDRSEARREEALANYRDTVLTAFREVESALAGEAFLRDQLEAVRTAAKESIGAQELAEERYERGLVDIITVLESQRRAFTSRSAVLSVQNQLLQNRLQLYLSLGGDFATVTRD